MTQWTIHEMRAADVDAALVVWDEAGTPVADSAFSVAEVIHAISEGDLSPEPRVARVPRDDLPRPLRPGTRRIAP